MLRTVLSLCALGWMLAGCVSLPKSAGPDSGVPMFTSDAQVDRYFAELQKEDVRRSEESNPEEQQIIVTGSRISAAPTITNVQEAGVDEGGIVKASGDYLIVLRRGRIFTIRHGDNSLKPVDHIDAFPPDDPRPDDTWYDELLVSGNTILSIGYSYGDDGTEISRFILGDDGSLSYRDTHYLTSSDYYSSRNYASRLIGDELILYAPVSVRRMDWRDGLPAVRKRMPDGTTIAVGETGGAGRLGVPARYLKEFHPDASTLHTVTRCDVESDDFDCETRMVLGGDSRDFYITLDAVYVWTEAPNDWRTDREDRDKPSMLYSIPHSGEIKAIAVSGAPVDQFSFLQDDDEDKLFVMVEENGWNGPMWASEFVDGDLALLELELDSFGDGSTEANVRQYRPLAPVDGYRIQNRYVGRFLLYGGGNYGDEDDTPGVFVTPLDGRWVQKVPLDHGVTRIDKMGIDPVVIGPGANEALGFSAIGLDPKELTAERLDTYVLPNADEGENRSQAFYFLPDSGDEEGTSGTLALPVVSEVNDDGGEFLGEASSIFYLRRNARKFAPAGNLYSEPRDPIDEDKMEEDSVNSEYDVDSAEEDNCKASCTDWYGNSRPIFLGDRIIALMGYEIVEGELQDGVIAERRRVNFAPEMERENGQ